MKVQQKSSNLKFSAIHITFPSDSLLSTLWWYRHLKCLGFGSLLEDSFPNTKEVEKEFIQSYLLLLFFLSLFFYNYKLLCVCIFSHCFREWANIYSERILWRNSDSFSGLWLLLPSPRSHFLPLCQIQATLPECCTQKEEEASHLCTLPQNMVENTDSSVTWHLCVNREQEENISVLTKKHSMFLFSVLACHVDQGGEVSPWQSLWSHSPPSGK